VSAPSYDAMLNAQVEAAKPKKKSMQDLLNAGETWRVG